MGNFLAFWITGIVILTVTMGPLLLLALAIGGH